MSTFARIAARAAAAGAAVYGPLGQGEFLGRLGIAQRLRAAARRSASPAQRDCTRERLRAAGRRRRHGRAVQGTGADRPGWPGAARLHGATSDGDEAAKSEALGGLHGVRHGFFGRQGGVSEGVWASLNVGLRSGDRPERIAANRARAARGAGRGAGPAGHGAPGPRCHGAGRGRALGQRGRHPKPTRW